MLQKVRFSFENRTFLELLPGFGPGTSSLPTVYLIFRSVLFRPIAQLPVLQFVQYHGKFIPLCIVLSCFFPPCSRNCSKNCSLEYLGERSSLCDLLQLPL